MTNCERYQQLLSGRLDESLPSEHGAALRKHLAACDRCREFEQELEDQRKVLARLPHLSADSLSLPTGTDTTRPNIAIRLWRARLSIPAPLAAVLVAAVVGWGLLSSIGLHRPEIESVPGERKVRVIQLDPTTAVRVGD
jgi:anti-sigma factor RsiW